MYKLAQVHHGKLAGRTKLPQAKLSITVENRSSALGKPFLCLNRVLPFNICSYAKTEDEGRKYTPVQLAELVLASMQAKQGSRVVFVMMVLHCSSPQLV